MILFLCQVANVSYIVNVGNLLYHFAGGDMMIKLFHWSEDWLSDNEEIVQYGDTVEYMSG